MSRVMKNSGIPWIGEIPRNWKVLRTKNVFSIGKDIVGAQSSNTQLLSLTTKGIKAIPVGSTSGKVPDSYDTYQVVHKNDLVMCLFDLDCSAVFSGLSSIDGMISPAYKVLSIRGGFSPRFYDYWYAYIFDGRKYKFLSKNIRYSLTYDEFASLGIVAPSFSEQEAIATFLDKKCGEIDEMISLQERIVSGLIEYRDALIYETIVEGALDHPKRRDSIIPGIDKIPTGWIEIKLKHLCSFHNGDRSESYPSGDDFVVTGVPFYGADSLNGFYVDINKARYITEEKYNSLGGLKIIAGDILYTLRGSTIGKNAMAIRSVGTTASSLMAIRVKSSLVDNRMLLYILNSPIEHFQRDVCINGSTAPNLSAVNVGEFIIPVPPIEEQHAIVGYLDEKCSIINSLIKAKQIKIDALRVYKKSIIYEYVTGKKEVPYGE